MSRGASESSDAHVSLRPVDRTNWSDVAGVKVSEAQRAFVAEPPYYLALCCYGGEWQPLAVYLDEQVVGFMMWATDPADGSCWFGGVVIDQRVQRRGYGSRAVRAAIAQLSRERGCRDFALSYQPTNRAARSAYRKLGFVETRELAEDEVVARLSLTAGGCDAED